MTTRNFELKLQAAEERGLWRRQRAGDFCEGQLQSGQWEVGHAEGSRWEQVRVPFSAVPWEDEGPERRLGLAKASDVGL